MGAGGNDHCFIVTEDTQPFKKCIVAAVSQFHLLHLRPSRQVWAGMESQPGRWDAAAGTGNDTNVFFRNLVCDAPRLPRDADAGPASVVGYTDLTVHMQQHPNINVVKGRRCCCWAAVKVNNYLTLTFCVICVCLVVKSFCSYLRICVCRPMRLHAFYSLCLLFLSLSFAYVV